jgi:NTE family protein
MQAYNIMGLKQIHKQAEFADVYIECMIENLSPMDFSSQKAMEIINRGRKYANENLDKLMKIKKMVSAYQTTVSNNHFFPIDTISVYDNVSFKDEEILRFIPKENLKNPENLVDNLTFIKDTLDLKEIKYSTVKLADNRNHLALRIKEKTPIIFGVYVHGNKIHTFGFIYRLLGIKPGTKFDRNLLEERINYLYGLGYFKKITYDLDFAIPGYVKLNINVIENPRRNIRFGLRYDNQYELVAAVSGQINNAFLPGLRLEDEMQFLGYTALSGKIYYPSRTLSIPIYPFAEVKYSNIPQILYYTNGEKLASYDYISYSASAGVGLLYKNFEHMQVYLKQEQIRAEPQIAHRFEEEIKNYRDKNTGFAFDYTLDLLDDYLYPKNGIYVKGRFEKTDDWLFDTDRKYSRYFSSIDFYLTTEEILTFHLNGYFCKTKNAPEYKYFQIGGPDNFIGVDYNQLFMKEMIFLRPEINVALFENFRWSMIYNYAFDFEHIFFDFEYVINDRMSAWGTGFEYKTAIGPIKFTIAKSIESITDKLNDKFYFYFTAGYNF